MRGGRQPERAGPGRAGGQGVQGRRQGHGASGHGHRARAAHRQGQWRRRGRQGRRANDPPGRAGRGRLLVETGQEPVAGRAGHGGVALRGISGAGEEAGGGESRGRRLGARTAAGAGRRAGEQSARQWPDVSAQCRRHGHGVAASVGERTGQDRADAGRRQPERQGGRRRHARGDDRRRAFARDASGRQLGGLRLGRQALADAHADRIRSGRSGRGSARHPARRRAGRVRGEQAVCEVRRHGAGQGGRHHRGALWQRGGQ